MHITPGEIIQYFIICLPGKVSGDEIVVCYISYEGTGIAAQLYSLKFFKRISLAAGESSTVHFTITPDMLQLVNDEGKNVLLPGKYKISIGGSLPGKRSEGLGASKGVTGEIIVR